MSTADISRAYELFYRLASRGGKYSEKDSDLLIRYAKDANAGVVDSEAKFGCALVRAEQALASGDDEALVAELIHLRMAAMSLVTDYDNLVDAVSELFEKDSIRSQNEAN